jgi:hypothetical protein
MRSHGISAIVMASMVITSGHVRSQEPTQPVLGYGPETFDWGAGWLASIFSFLSSILVLAFVIGLVILLVRWVVPPGRRALHPNRSARGGA